MPIEDYKRTLMYRIYLVYMTRKIMNRRGLGVGWLVASSLVLFWFVSVLNVARNFWFSMNDFGSAYSFVTHSFINTSLVVQTAVIGTIAVCAFFVADLYRARFYQ